VSTFAWSHASTYKVLNVWWGKVVNNHSFFVKLILLLFVICIFFAFLLEGEGATSLSSGEVSLNIFGINTCSNFKEWHYNYYVEHHKPIFQQCTNIIYDTNCKDMHHWLCMHCNHNVHISTLLTMGFPQWEQ